LNEFAALIEMELRGGSSGRNEPNFREVASSVLEVIEQFSHKTKQRGFRAMMEPQFSTELPQRAEQALQHLLRLMEDPTAKPRDKNKGSANLKLLSCTASGS